LFDVLQHRAYLEGTHYYCGYDSFFFFVSRLLIKTPESAVRKRFGPLLAKHIQVQFGTAGDALALSMRIIAASRVGLWDQQDFDQLLRMQEADGSWPLGWLCKFNSGKHLMGNKCLTTALAIQALKLQILA
jgi:hypothetical protein